MLVKTSHALPVPRRRLATLLGAITWALLRPSITVAQERFVPATPLDAGTVALDAGTASQSDGDSSEPEAGSLSDDAGGGEPEDVAKASMPATPSAQLPPSLHDRTGPSEAPAQAATSAPETPVEVTVRGGHSQAKRLQRSADAVTVVELKQAKKRSGDLGEVLARVQGVALRRAGGLGSDTRFSLNGLYDDQISFFVDAIPLELAGYPFGIANVPVNLTERIELYRGVVPIRFGASALGGAVNLVSDWRRETGGNASVQVGSFGTVRTTALARYLHEPSGLVARASGWFDAAKNNYPVEVMIPDLSGTRRPARVRRFHDRYLSWGSALELGVVDRPWARQLLLRAFAAAYEKELQSNFSMTTPYGEVHYGERVQGLTLRYEQPLAPGLELELLGSFAYRTIDFVDRGEWSYDWYGNRIAARNPGEIRGDPTDQSTWQRSGFARAGLAWTLSPSHVLRVSTTTSYAFRTGKERISNDPNARDPLSAERGVFSWITGIAYELNVLPYANSPQLPAASTGVDRYRLQNILFAKSYVYFMDSEEIIENVVRKHERDGDRFGVGDSLRVSLTRWLLAKASYELATRIPNASELFGLGTIILPNLDLEPEVSHNVNVGPRLELMRARMGELTVDVNGFLRESDQLIVLLGAGGEREGDRALQYQNVYRARSLGVEGSAAWTSPGRYLTLDGSTAFQDQRNTSRAGSFGANYRDRVPNRPWLFASWGARLRFAHLARADDELEPYYLGRYVHSFLRGWESLGRPDSKAAIPAQTTHALGVSYSLRWPHARLSTSFEAQNVTDAKVYDFYGVQRPGRAFYAKLTAEL